MGVVAKFRVNSIENSVPVVEYEGSEGQPVHGPVRKVGRVGEEYLEAAAKVKLSAVYVTEDDESASEEDIMFSLATPLGQIEMNISNPAALEQFQPGDQFLVTFNKV